VTGLRDAVLIRGTIAKGITKQPDIKRHEEDATQDRLGYPRIDTAKEDERIVKSSSRY
jgi:hypothetical protein